MSLSEMSKKLENSFYTYLHNLIAGTHHILPLAELVAQSAIKQNLGTSWAVY